MDGFTHLDDKGKARMVDVSGKNDTARIAKAEGKIVLSPEAYSLAVSGDNPKGNVFATARIAGIMASKRTSDVIPLCHPLMITGSSVDFVPDDDTHSIICTASVKTTGKTGVEMEALTAVSAALLTVYDMCKAVDKSMVIEGIRLLEKDGGRSGHYIAGE